MAYEIPAFLTYSFYGLVAWALSALFVAFRLIASDKVGVGIIMRIFVVAWMGVPALLAINGWLLDFTGTPPNMMKLVAPLGLSVLLFALSPYGKKTAERLPESLLIGTQMFRVPLEMVLYGLSARLILPVEMTFKGYNFDILTGLLALPLWYLVRSHRAPRWALWAWNVMGTVLLVTIVSIAVAAMPAPFGKFTPPNLLIAFYPWIWLPTFLVQIAWASHLLLFRKLLLPVPPRLNI